MPPTISTKAKLDLDQLIVDEIAKFLENESVDDCNAIARVIRGWRGQYSNEVAEKLHAALNEVVAVTLTDSDSLESTDS